MKHLLKNPFSLAFRLIQFAGVMVMVISGGDKFFNLLVDWEIYLAPFILMFIPLPKTLLLFGLGIIEIIIGILIAVKPKIGSIFAAGLHLGIITNLLILRNYYNVALIDFGILLAYLALWQLAMYRDSVQHR